MTSGRLAENLALVERGYEALERDDIGALLQLCDPDAEWRYRSAKPSAREANGHATAPSWPSPPTGEGDGHREAA